MPTEPQNDTTALAHGIDSPMSPVVATPFSGPPELPPSSLPLRSILGLFLAMGKPLVSFTLTLLGALLLVQLLLWAAPGDPVDLVPNGESMRSALEQEWGLDKSPARRYWSFVTRALRGDLGYSLTFRPGAQVLSLMTPAALRSLQVLLPALVLVMPMGLGLAWFTAGHTRLSRRPIQALSVTPVFLMAFMVVHLANETTFTLMEAGRISRPDWFALPDTDSWLKLLLSILILAVGSGSLAEVHAACENEIRRVRNSTFLDAAKARGASVWPHLLPNLVGPLSAVASSRVVFLMGGLIIVEKVMHLNGVGAMLWQACLMRDYPVALGITVLAAATVAGTRLLADILRVAVDPRLREIP